MSRVCKWFVIFVKTWFHTTRRPYSIRTFKGQSVVGIVAGFGTTFAAVPDLVAMFKRRSSAGMNPRMKAIMGAFQILWVFYGLLSSFATGDRIERGRGVDQVPKCRGGPLFRPQGKSREEVISMFGSFRPSPLVGLRLQSLLGLGADLVYGSFRSKLLLRVFVSLGRLKALR